MTAISDEQVLCTHRSEMPSDWLRDEGSLSLSLETWEAGIRKCRPLWLPRAEAERSPDAKQWIPYALLRNSRGAIASYPRGGSESRLHGRWSLGIGGHINPEDKPSGFDLKPDWTGILQNALRRELAEEFPGTENAPARFLGLVHEESTPVGCVHIGAVFIVGVAHSIGPPGPELRGLRWIPEPQLGSERWPLSRFETWSRLALQLADSAPIS